jgi:hypothetical protein
MPLDDRDYYREELARKRGVRPPAPFGQDVPTAKPKLPRLTPQPMWEPSPRPTTPPRASKPIAAPTARSLWLWNVAIAVLGTIILAELLWLMSTTL